MCRQLLTYLCNVLLDPLKQLSLVQKADIQVAILDYFLSGKKPKDSNAVVEIDNDNRPVRADNESSAVVICVVIGRVASARDINVHRKLRRRRGVRRGPDIDIEAILAPRAGNRIGLADASGTKLYKSEQ